MNQENNPYRNIVTLRGGAIGDFVLTLPALRALRAHFPKAHIRLVGYPRVTALALEADLVDEALSIEQADVASLFAAEPAFSAEWKEMLGSCDLAVSYLHDPDGLVRRNLAAAGVGRVLACSPMVTMSHATEHLMRPLKALGIPVNEQAVPSLNLQETTLALGVAGLSRFGGDVVMLHPGSGSPSKNWPIDRFLELAHRLHGEGLFQPVFATGEAEGLVNQSIRSSGTFSPMLRQESLVDLAGVLSSSRAYVGNDSGITHLAAAIGIPVVALFGPTEAAKWAPRGKHVRIIRSPERSSASLGDISVDRVYRELRDLLAEV